MKKSYDYFKTLKLLSEITSEIYKKSASEVDFSPDRILFLAEKSELLNSLRNEFITPLERGDIFFLAECLTEEVNSIYSLYGYSSLINQMKFDSFEESFNSQTLIFNKLKDFKSNLKLFEQCSQEAGRLGLQKKKFEEQAVNALKINNGQGLKKYAVCSAFLTLNNSIYKTIIQIERILIDNS